MGAFRHGSGGGAVTVVTRWKRQNVGIIDLCTCVYSV